MKPKAKRRDKRIRYSQGAVREAKQARTYGNQYNAQKNSAGLAETR